MLRRLGKWLVLWILAGLLLAMAAMAILYAALPPVALLKNHYPVVHYQGKGQPPRVTLASRRPPGWVPLSAVSPKAVGAILVSEDWAFYQHRGYDWNQIKESFQENWKARRFVRGASTITQQVARNVFLSKDKNLWRKARELAVAVELEKQLKKRQILEIYLNLAEWGEGIFGIGAASQYYFHKPPSELDAKEGAFLAMLLPSPQRYSVSFQRRQLTRYASRTIDSILKKMVQAGYVKEEEWGPLSAQALSFEQAPSSGEEPPEEEESLWGIF